MIKKTGKAALWLLMLLLVAGIWLLSGCGGSGRKDAQSTPAASSLAVSDSEGSEADISAASGQESAGSDISALSESESAKDKSAISVRADDEQSADEEDRLSRERGMPANRDVPDEDGSYTSKEDVGLYLHLYGHLPGNYITKKEAEKRGWDSHAGNLQDVAPGKSIGGSRFGNYEGLLPDKKGRTYYECDINYDGGYRGAERIIYSDDGLIFYTGDHYKSFEQLY